MNRNTKQRQLIYDVVTTHMDHPDVDAIYSDVHKANPKISKGTIYRNLNLLAEQGLIKQIKVPGGSRFDFRIDNHNHIICNVCGKMIDSPIVSESKIEKSIETKTGYKILGHSTVFNAICPECLKNIKKKEKQNE